MFNLKNNKYFIAGFAILMVVGLMAAYIPMLFPQTPAGQAETVSGGTSGDVSGAAQLNQTVPDASTTPTSTKSADLPASLSGLQTDLNGLNDLQNSLNQGR